MIEKVVPFSLSLPLTGLLSTFHKSKRFSIASAETLTSVHQNAFASIKKLVQTPDSASTF